MALYAIGDLHLSLGDPKKSMEVFGGAWTDYTEKLRAGFASLEPEDTVVLCGDISWGMGLTASEPDFAFLDALPGRKLLLKGNHDYWWTTAAKMQRFFSERGFATLSILHNNSYSCGGMEICGTRGWFYEEDAAPESAKVFRRELGRLEASLASAGTGEKLCFLHYPPLYRNYICPELIALMERSGVRRCFYGHLHGPAHHIALEGLRGTINYTMVSADYLNFKPLKINGIF